MGLPEVQARVRFLGLGLMMLALGGCASNKFDEKVSPSKLFVSYEADVSGNLVELGECIADKGNASAQSSGHDFEGRFRTLNRYTVEGGRQEGFESAVVRLHKTGTRTANVFLTPTYVPSKHAFVEHSEMIRFISECADDDVRNAKSYSSNQKRYVHNLEVVQPAQAKQNLISLVSVDLPEYAGTGTSTADFVLKRMRARVGRSEELFIESALAGDLSPLDIYYTREGFQPKLLQKYYKESKGNLPESIFFLDTVRPFISRLNPKRFSLVCSSYAYGGGVFSSAKMTSERNVVLLRGEQILDGVIVREDHPFYKACLSGEEIHS